MSDDRQFRVSETLRDGSVVTVRAVRPDDAERLTNAFAGLDAQSVYTRFFAPKKELSPSEIARIAAMDFVGEVMLVATVEGSSGETIVASAHYVADEGAVTREAEIAFVVEEDYQGRGIARRLLGHLVAIARKHGIRRFVADVLPDNRAMRAVFARAGLAVRERREGGVVRVEIDL